MALPGDPSPSFAKPPLQEVALAIQFQPQAVDILTSAEFGRLLAEAFPRQEEQPGRPPMTEDFAKPVQGQPPFRLEVMPALPPYRLWFLSATGARLVQLQADLLALNWRRTVEDVVVDDDYPRYTTLRADLADYVQLLDQTALERGRGRCCPTGARSRTSTKSAHLGRTRGVLSSAMSSAVSKCRGQVASSRSLRTPASTSGSLFLARMDRAAGSPSRWCLQHSPLMGSPFG